MGDSPQGNLLHRSVISETKEKMDIFLKHALQDTSQKGIIEESKTRSKSPQSFSLSNLNYPSEEENKEFILNKFFENSLLVNEVKPIPKPRTKFRSNNLKNSSLSPHSSNETFKIRTEEKMSLEENKIQSNNSSASTTNTYKVTSPKILNTQDDDLSSQRTYRITKDVPKIGDIIIHEKDNIPKIVDVQVNTPKDSEKEVISNSSHSTEVSVSRNNTFIKSSKRVNDKNMMKNSSKTIHAKAMASILNIKIHRTDKLKLNSLVIHPVVKIHIVDIRTGEYFTKKVRDSSVGFHDDNLDYIAPIMTQPYSLQEKRSLIPSWQETISINEDYDYFVEQKDNLILFFELLDFISMPILKNDTEGWHRIAVAFLKVGGKNNVLNLNKNMRLQLYYCSSKKKDTRKCSIWEIWSKDKLFKYPSSLYISITRSELKDKASDDDLSLKKEIRTISKIKDNGQGEIKNTLILSLKNTLDSNKECKGNNSEATKLPNECLAQFETDEEGCFTLRFSHNGLLLACSIRLQNEYCIAIFSTVTFEQVCYLPGHQDLIYSIRWSSDDSLVIACSADCSVSVWDVNHVAFLQILPHPNFVYANEICYNLIATGCYDGKLRIWNNEGFVSKYMLSQELDGHKGYITSLLFKKNFDAILSSDSVGVIIEWSKRKFTWVYCKKINITSLEGIIINQIEFLAKEKRLLVHSRDNILRIIDLDSSIVVHWLRGGINTRFHTSCSVSSCGNYVIAGSENSSVNIWKSKTGKCIGSLIPYKNKTITIHALQFHPKDNTIAVGSFGNNLPVLLFGFNGNKQENNIDLRLIPEKIGEGKEGENSKYSVALKNKKEKYNFKHVLDRLDELMSGKFN